MNFSLLLFATPLGLIPISNILQQPWILVWKALFKYVLGFILSGANINDHGSSTTALSHTSWVSCQEKMSILTDLPLQLSYTPFGSYSCQEQWIFLYSFLKTSLVSYVKQKRIPSMNIFHKVFPPFSGSYIERYFKTVY